MGKRLIFRPDIKFGNIVHNGDVIFVNGVSAQRARAWFGGMEFDGLEVVAGAEYELDAMLFALSRVRRPIDRSLASSPIPEPAWVKDSFGRIVKVRAACIQVPMLPAPEPLFGYTSATYPFLNIMNF